MEPTVENFFEVMYQQAPEGAWYFANRIIKEEQKPHPRFSRDWNEIVKALKSHRESSSGDFYFSPATYYRPTKPIKANCRGSRVAWVDVDGNLPTWDIRPNVLVETSPEHFHGYWLLDSFKPTKEIEAINRSLAYQYDLDKSGWDCTQLLRPPGSFNRKRSNFQARIIEWNLDQTAVFPVEPISDDQTSERRAGNLGVQRILAEEVFPKRIIDLIFEKTESKSEGRSGVYFELACELIKSGLPNDRILILLDYLDDRLGKFKQHSNRENTLQGILASARQKTGIPRPTETEHAVIYSMVKGWEKMADEEIQERDSDIMKDFVLKDGILVIGGVPGCGKSRLVSNMAFCIATGTSFLGKTVQTPKKVAYLNLDQPNQAARKILASLLPSFQMDLLNQNMMALLRGFSLDLTDSTNQRILRNDLDEFEADVVIIDTITRSVEDSKEGPTVQKLMDWIADQRRTWILVSHPRKLPAANPKYQRQTLDNLYGSVYWAAAADTVLMLEHVDKEERKMYAVKDRHGVFADDISLFLSKPSSLYKLSDKVENSEATNPPSDGKLGSSL